MTEEAKSSYAKTEYSVYEVRITVVNLLDWQWLENIYFFNHNNAKGFLIFFFLVAISNRRTEVVF